MPSTPRIARAKAGPNITPLDQPVPVIARLHWLSLKEEEDVQAWAIATSPAGEGLHASTLIVWADIAGPQQDWIRSSEIRRPGEQYAGEQQFPWQPQPRLRAAVRPGPPRP